MPSLCWVPGCPAGDPATKDSPVTLFSFPCDEDIREKWLLAIPSIDSSSLDDAKVCEKHFTADLILSIQDGDDSDVLELAEGAVPSIFNVTPVSHVKDMRMKKKLVHSDLPLPKPCCVFGCDSNAPSRKNATPIPVFRFPKKKQLILKWLKVIWRKDWKPGASSVVCILHFQPDDFIMTRKVLMPDGSVAVRPQTIRQLKAAAIPSRFGDPLGTTGLDGTHHGRAIGGESSAKRDEDMLSDTGERLPAFLSEYVECQLDGHLKEENSHIYTLNNQESYFENMMADLTPPIEIENYNQRSRNSTKASQQSDRKRRKSQKVKERVEYVLTSKQKKIRDKWRIARNTESGMDYILPNRSHAELDDSSPHLNGLPAPIVVKTEESPRVFATVQGIADSWKRSALHGQSVPYVKMHKMVDAGVFMNEHNYALSSDKAHFQAAELDQMADNHFEEVIIESLIGDIKEETDCLETDESLNISNKVNYPTVDVDSEIWITSDVNSLMSMDAESSAVECDVVEYDVESNVAESNVVKCNVMESCVVESNVMESNVVDSNVMDSDVADGNVSDGSDSVNAFLECPARFDGSPVSSVDGFIECVEIYRKANIIKHPEALRDFHILLQEDAAVWWKGCKSTVTSWARAVTALRSNYGTKRSADDVYRCIVKSVRGKDESHASFVDRVLKLFSELPYAVKSFMKIDMIYALLDDDVRGAVPRSRLTSTQDLSDSLRSFDENLKLPNKVIKSNKKGTNHTYRNFVNVVRCFQCKVMRQKQSELQAELDGSALKECITCYKRNLCKRNKIKLPCQYCKKLGDKLVALQEEYLLSVKLLEGRNIDNDDDIIDLRCSSCCVLRDELTQRSRNCKMCIRINADIDDSLTKAAVRVDNATYIESNRKMKEKCARMEKEAVVMTKCKHCDKKTIDRHDGESLLTDSCLRCIPLKSVQIKLDRKARAHSKLIKNQNKKNDSILVKAIQMSDINIESRIDTNYSILLEDFVSKTTMKSPLNIHPAVNSGSKTKPKLDVPLPVSLSLPGITIKPILKDVVPKKRIRNRDKQKGGTLLAKATKTSLRKTAGANKMKDSPIDQSKLNLYIRIVMNDSMNIMAMLDPLDKNNFLSEKLFEVLVKTNYKFIELPATMTIHGKESDVQSVLSTVVSVNFQGMRLETPFWYMKGVDDKTRLGEDFIRDTGIVTDRLREVWYFKTDPHKSYPLEMKP